jgi:superfamily II DNA or RNA helicase
VHDVTLRKVNETYIAVDAEIHIIRQMSDHFTFFVEGAQFSPKFKEGFWDGKIRLLNKNNRQIYTGLVDEVEAWCSDNGYSVAVGEGVRNTKNVPDNAAEVITKSIGTSDEFKPRYYQSLLVADALRNGRGFYISPTASGKSFVVYLLAQYMKAKGKRTLVVLPSVGLVKQIAGDFADYAGGNATDLHMIAEGSSKDTDAPIVLSTWQSIFRLPESWFSQFDCVIGDEADEFSAESLKKLLEKCVQVPYRYGFTGTLEDCKTDRLVLTGLFGPIRQYVTTKDLIDQGYLSELTINVLVLSHSETTRKALKNGKGKSSYDKEIEFLENLECRNKYIAKLAENIDGNSLLLFTHIKRHGDIIKPILESGKKPVHYVHGKVDADVREKVRAIVEKSDNAVVLGSYGTFSRGTNIKRLDNIIFTIAYKSKKRVLQSIGRGLRRGKDSTHTKLYDIVDDLSTVGENYSMKHFRERMDMYTKEGFKVKIYKVELK